MQSTSVYLVSACLAGLATRYDGRIIANPACRRALAGSVWIPVCPEQLGGLPTPRVPADLVGGNGADVLAGRARVMTKDGRDVTEIFIAGAKQVLDIAQSQAVAAVFLKAHSPSCGISPLTGVTAALLMENGFTLREF